MIASTPQGPLKGFIKVIRVRNLLLITLTQYYTYFFLLSEEFQLSNADWKLHLVVAATILVAAAGYIINDYYDIKIDYINKPDRVVIGSSIKRRVALFIHSILNVLATILGIIVSWHVGIIIFASSFFLWLYSNSLKRLPLAGNVMVSILTAASVYIITFGHGFFDLNVLFFSVFAFLISLLREVVKDMEDLEGDLSYGSRTLPITVGIRKSKLFLLATTIIFIAFPSVLIIQGYQNYIFVLIGLALALLVFAIVLLRADTKQEYHRVSQFIKLIMVVGVISMAFI